MKHPHGVFLVTVEKRTKYDKKFELSVELTTNHISVGNSN